jgi:hypothetical protein
MNNMENYWLIMGMMGLEDHPGVEKYGNISETWFWQFV